MQNSLLIKNNKLLYLISSKLTPLWKVNITDAAFETLVDGSLNNDDLEVIRRWTRFVAAHGPFALVQKMEVWADHELFDEWMGHRASSFSYRGRIIYRVEEKIVTVVVVGVTNNHDYKLRSE